MHAPCKVLVTTQVFCLTLGGQRSTPQPEGPPHRSPQAELTD